jgi:hypothetical protein
MRQVIQAKDIQVYFGKKESMSFKMMREMKIHYNKSKYQPISIKDFCDYYKVDEQSVIKTITKIDGIP